MSEKPTPPDYTPLHSRLINGCLPKGEPRSFLREQIRAMSLLSRWCEVSLRQRVNPKSAEFRVAQNDIAMLTFEPGWEPIPTIRVRAKHDCHFFRGRPDKNGRPTWLITLKAGEECDMFYQDALAFQRDLEPVSGIEAYNPFLRQKELPAAPGPVKAMPPVSTEKLRAAIQLEKQLSEQLDALDSAEATLKKKISEIVGSKLPPEKKRMQIKEASIDAAVDQAMRPDLKDRYIAALEDGEREYRELRGLWDYKIRCLVVAEKEAVLDSNRAHFDSGEDCRRWVDGHSVEPPNLWRLRRFFYESGDEAAHLSSSWRNLCKFVGEKTNEIGRDRLELFDQVIAQAKLLAEQMNDLPAMEAGSKKLRHLLLGTPNA